MKARVSETYFLRIWIAGRCYKHGRTRLRPIIMNRAFSCADEPPRASTRTVREPGGSSSANASNVISNLKRVQCGKEKLSLAYLILVTINLRASLCWAAKEIEWHLDRRHRT